MCSLAATVRTRASISSRAVPCRRSGEAMLSYTVIAG